MRLRKQTTPLIAINAELETRSGAAGHQTIHSYGSSTSKDDVHFRPDVGEAGVVDPISNAPVYPEPDQGNGQGEGQDQAEKLECDIPTSLLREAPDLLPGEN